MRNIQLWILRRQPRELVLGAFGVLGLVTLLVMAFLVKPAWNQWQNQRELLQLRQDEFLRISQNLALNDNVIKGNAELAKVADQTGSDETTLSNYLKTIEAVSTAQKVMLTNMKPLPVERNGATNLYRTRLVVQGKMQETIRFVNALMQSTDATGLEAASIQGLQAGEMIETHLSLIMVKLLKDEGKPRKSDKAKGLEVRHVQ